MIFGNPMTFTIEPENIQAILAKQFKEFGLGETRNANFNPLLGHGIVSSPKQLKWGSLDTKISVVRL